MSATWSVTYETATIQAGTAPTKEEAERIAANVHDSYVVKGLNPDALAWHVAPPPEPDGCDSCNRAKAPKGSDAARPELALRALLGARADQRIRRGRARPGLAGEGGRAMSAHTPGPWKVSSVKRFIETADGAVTVAEVRGRGRDVNTDVDDDANARLIAAAPGMAEALRDAARWIDTLPDDLRLGSIMPEKIRAALKQAGAL